MQKIGFGRKLGRARTKHLSAQIIPDKILGIKWRNPVKLDSKRKVWYPFLRAL